jgi:hypothetical protein
MDARERRLAQNEALFREVNEKVEAVAAVHGADDHIYEFYCECANADCSLHVRATIEEYESVRAFSTRFLVAPEHWLPEVESVTEKHDRFWVIEKHGDAGRLVAHLDPRGRRSS